MTKEEFIQWYRSRRKKLGLKEQIIAQQLGYDKSTLFRKCKGEIPWNPGNPGEPEKLATILKFEEEEWKKFVQAAWSLHPGATPQPELSKAHRRYLERLSRRCQALPLAALGRNQDTDKRLTLDHIYIALDTTSRVPATQQKRGKRQAQFLRPDADERLLTALEAAAQASRLALLGDPGSGKSTFVRNLLAWLAAANLGEKEPPPGFKGDLLPILVTLRDLVSDLGKLELDHLPVEKQTKSLAAIVREQILKELANLDAEDFAAELREAFVAGRCLLVLDGLDEVPQALRRRVGEAARAVIEQYDPARIILTCRVRSYVGEAVIPNFEAHTLALFDEDKISVFSQTWYMALERLGQFKLAEAERRGQELTKAALSEGLRKLAENPMLLTTIAIIHEQKAELPRQRVRLYKLAVEVLLQGWQKWKTGKLPLSGSLALILEDNSRLRRVMVRLAYEAHQTRQGGENAADLSRDAALTLLKQQEYIGNAGLAEEFLDYVDHRAGLLIGQGGETGQLTTYRFPHRTFQEYLAGCELVEQEEATNQEFYERAGEGDYWALAAQLATEELYYNQSPNRLRNVMYHLCPEKPESGQDYRAVLWSGNMAALLGREMIEQHKSGPVKGLSFLEERLLPHLVTLIEKSDLTIPERAEAGRALARLGDPREGVTGLEQMEFCFVPAGPFMMGSDEDESEKPLHRYDLRYDYWIARYPVTVAQFRAFVEASRYQPDSPYSLQGFDNHPVVSVTWYEAIALGEWLTGAWQAKGWLPPDWRVTLPSEAEWEKAARGGLEFPADPLIDRPQGFQKLLRSGPPTLRPNPQPQRRYPWGEQPDPNRANYRDTGLGTTSTVGCFSGGISPYGCQDMSGNVWEWTRNLWGKGYDQPDFKYPYNAADDREKLDAGTNVLRVLRGGSWYVNQGDARCAVRYRLDPYGGGLLHRISGGGLPHFVVEILVSEFLEF